MSGDGAGRRPSLFLFLCSNSLVLLKDALTSAVNSLTAANVGSPRMNAELLLMFTLCCDRAYLFAHPERKLTVEEKNRYEEALTRRASGVPAQYITGHQEFWGMDLIVSPAVLVPRPETEHVVEKVVALAKDKLVRAGGVSPGTHPFCVPMASLWPSPMPWPHPGVLTSV